MIYALEMLEFDIAEFRFLRRSSDDDCADKSDVAKYWIPEEDRRKNGEKDLFLWKRGNIDVTEYARKEDPLLKLELPLVDATGKRAIGVLWLVKDLKRDQITHYTFRRVEHLRRTIVGVLGRMEK